MGPSVQFFSIAILHGGAKKKIHAFERKLMNIFQFIMITRGPILRGEGESSSRLLKIQHLSCLRRGLDREFSEGTREVKRGAKFRRRVASTNERPGLNQSLLHLGAPWQNSILSRRLPTLNFDTLRSHQASQHWSKLAFATPRGRGMKRRVVNLVIRLPLRRGTSRMPRYVQVGIRSARNLPLADTYRST